MKYEAILFDLDGTLLDSAPDLVVTLNDLLSEFQRPTYTVDDLRQYVSYGSTKLLEMGFGGDYPMDFQALRQRFLARYQQQNAVKTTFFTGVQQLLQNIEASNTPWGIITNKPTAPTILIAEHFQLDKRAAAIVCGDTLPVAKPDPSPIILACEMIGVRPQNCVYIGDCDRDIEAGKNAGMATIACAYGYIHAEAPISRWGADAIAQQPADIWPLCR